MTGPDMDSAFDALRNILRQYQPHLVTVDDSPTNFYLDTAHIQANRKPLYFGSTKIGRQYVSYHLMPVYLWPELLDGMSDELGRRMQGKSCFNFKRPDPALFDEIAELTRAGFERYREHGYVQ